MFSWIYPAIYFDNEYVLLFTWLPIPVTMFIAWVLVESINESKKIKEGFKAYKSFDERIKEVEKTKKQ